MKKRILFLIIGAIFVLNCQSTKDSGEKTEIDGKKDVTIVHPGKPKLKKEGQGQIALEATSGVQDGESVYYNRADKIAQPQFNTEQYKYIEDNAFFHVKDRPLSTFSIDVDTASYSNIRRFLNGGSLPPKDAVRVEEMVNYFTYDYPNPKEGPFSINLETTNCPWNKDNRLVLVGIQGQRMEKSVMPPRNLVFLIDTSGSMEDENKLPLLRKAFKLLVNDLTEKDHVAIVAYAGSAGLVLPSTNGSKKQTILESLEKLAAGGSTNGGAGIELAYKTAREHFVKGGVNRVILATDGDFNVGNTSEGGLTRLIEKQRESGVFLTVLGFGMGNYKDGTMETLADKGNGNYAYIDNFPEAKKALVDQASSTFVTIAKDVKIQVEFNPAFVESYRLIGYENRVMKDEDFNDDKKDAGEIGAGHSVTALYEIVPAGSGKSNPKVDPLRYQTEKNLTEKSKSEELLTLKIRYKEPDGFVSKLLVNTLKGSDLSFDKSSENLRWAATVAAFGMLLRDSEHKGNADYKFVLTNAQKTVGKDEGGYRSEFVRLVNLAKELK